MKHVLFALTLIVMVIGAASAAAQESDTITVDLPDFGSVSYPIDTYSLRPYGLLSPEASARVVFPGAFSISPNDSFVAQEAAAGNIAYEVQFAQVVSDSPITNDTLPTLLGQLVLLPYEAAFISDLEVTETTIAGLPAVRVDDLALRGDGPVPSSHYVVQINEGIALEIVVVPAVLYAAPNFNTFMTGDADANRAIVESIVESIALL